MLAPFLGSAMGLTTGATAALGAGIGACAIHIAQHGDMTVLYTVAHQEEVDAFAADVGHLARLEKWRGPGGLFYIKGKELGQAHGHAIQHLLQ